MLKDKFICKRCGSCCLELARKNAWLGGLRSWKKKQELLAKRKTLPENDKGCAMLYFKGKIASCLVREIYGIEKLDVNCVNYPKENELCFKEKEK